MKVFIKLSLLVAFILAVFVVLPPAIAQSDGSSLASVQVDLWPDYDQPSVLILVTAELPSDIQLPATIKMQLPDEAGNPSAVAYIAPDGGMFSVDYELNTDDGTWITINTPEPNVRVEYYMPYQRNGDSILFDYTWSAGITVDDLAIVFQEPAGATAVRADDRFLDLGVLDDGRHYRQWKVGPVSADDQLVATLGYTLPENVSLLDDNYESPVPTTMTWLAGGGGLILGGIGGWFLARRRMPIRSGVRKKKPVTNPNRSRRDKPVAFCPQCGTPKQPKDVYCRQCGEKLA